MLMLFIKSYFAILTAISVAALSIFMLGSYIILRRFYLSSQFPAHAKHDHDTPKELDLNALMAPIAGDDLIATQLDLARAYIETNQLQEASAILKKVMEEGSKEQQEEAKDLMNTL